MSLKMKQSMGEWKKKKYRKSKHASQTPGKLKGERCTATVTDKFFAKRSRSHKHKDYGFWLRKTWKLVYGISKPYPQ